MKKSVMNAVIAVLIVVAVAAVVYFVKAPQLAPDPNPKGDDKECTPDTSLTCRNVYCWKAKKDLSGYPNVRYTYSSIRCDEGATGGDCKCPDYYWNSQSAAVSHVGQQ